MNMERAAADLRATVDGHDQHRSGTAVRVDGLAALVLKYVPAGTEDRALAERALGHIEGVASMLSGLKERG